MRYTKSAFDRAELVLQERQQTSENEYQARLHEIAEKAPEIYRLHLEALRLNYSLIGSIGRQNSEKLTLSQQISAIKNKNLSVRQTLRGMLSASGYPEDYLQYHYFCDICRDTGYHEGVRCRCMKELLERYTIEELNSHCSIAMHDFNEFRLDYYSASPMADGESQRDKMRRVYETCLRYTSSFNENAPQDSPSLYFYGRTGLGKTFLSSCIAKNLIDRHCIVVYGSATNLLHRIEEERFRKAEGDTTSILLEAELLILDDLGAEFKTTFTESVVYEVVNERINNRRPTIISTNKSLQEMYKTYNERIASRLVGNYIPIQFYGGDIRQIKPSYV